MAQTLKSRHEELLALRSDNAHRERRFYGASADKEIVKKPVYDVRVLDSSATHVARQIRLREQGDETPRQMSNENRDDEPPNGWAHAAAVPPRRHQLRVDFSERSAAVLDLARGCVDFDVQMVHLSIGDYFIDSGVVVERKTYADFATSLVDGRLFPQAAALARSPHRPVILLEGPKPSRMPDVHPHALKGAIVSLAVMWRLPVLHARDPEDALRILRFLAQQVGDSEQLVLRRYDRKPKRVASRRLYVLQGLSGVGPSLAQRLLIKFGSVERVMTADERSLTQVRGIGFEKAARIRELVSG